MRSKTSQRWSVLVLASAMLLACEAKQSAPSTPPPETAAPNTGQAEVAPPAEQSADTQISPPESLLGHWTVDFDGLAQLPEFKRLPEKQRTLSIGLMKQSRPLFEFTDKRIEMSGELNGKKMTESYPYRVVKLSNEMIVIEASKVSGAVERKEIMISGDQLKMKEGSRTILLRRIDPPKRP